MNNEWRFYFEALLKIETVGLEDGQQRGRGT